MEIKGCEGTERTELLRQQRKKTCSLERNREKKEWPLVKRETERNDCEHENTMEKEQRYTRRMMVVEE